MTDYVAIMLNGLFTGIGVILAHEIYDAFKKYRKKIEEGIIKNGTQNEHQQNEI